MAVTASDPAWQVFAALQSHSDPQSVDRSLARDEALDAVLDDIVSAPAPDERAVQKRYYSLCRNRLSKQKNRRALDRSRSRGTHRRGGSEFGSVLLTPPAHTVSDHLAYKQLVALISTELLAEELRLLLDIADGRSYVEMARDWNTSVSGLKSKAFRIRQKLRHSRIGATLLPAAQGRADQ
jgi:hypothetical protein